MPSSPARIVLTSVDETLTTWWEDVAAAFDHVQAVRGSILDVECDAVVSPANSFGFMDGGLDAVYTEFFGRGVQDELRRIILDHHEGELLLGQAEIVSTRHGAIPYLIASPTMRVPMRLPADTINPFLAARAVLRLIRSGVVRDGPFAGPPVAQHVRIIAFPGLGTE